MKGLLTKVEAAAKAMGVAPESIEMGFSNFGDGWGWTAKWTGTIGRSKKPQTIHGAGIGPEPEEALEDLQRLYADRVNPKAAQARRDAELKEQAFQAFYKDGTLTEAQIRSMCEKGDITAETRDRILG